MVALVLRSDGGKHWSSRVHAEGALLALCAAVVPAFVLLAVCTKVARLRMGGSGSGSEALTTEAAAEVTL